jgi:transcriptional regulator with XRE-family HTH domain
LEKLVSPQGGRLERIEKVVVMSISVQKLCKQKGVSLPSLSERSGLDLKRVQTIYRGQWTPSPSEREKIAQALSTSSDDIAWEHTTPIEHFYGPG